MNLARKIQSKTLNTIIFGTMLFVPIFSFGVVPSVENINVTQAVSGLKVTWNQLALSETQAIILLKKENECPQSFSDGQEIYRGNGSQFEDKEVAKGKSYCYGAFVYDISGFSSQLVRTKLINKKGILAFWGEFFKQNDMIVWGVAIVALLLFVNHKTMNEKRRIFGDLKTEADGH